MESLYSTVGPSRPLFINSRLMSVASLSLAVSFSLKSQLCPEEQLTLTKYCIDLALMEG